MAEIVLDFRSARLTISDWFHIDQSNVVKRAALSVPLLAETHAGRSWAESH